MWCMAGSSKVSHRKGSRAWRQVWETRVHDRRSWGLKVCLNGYSGGVSHGERNLPRWEMISKRCKGFVIQFAMVVSKMEMNSAMMPIFFERIKWLCNVLIMLNTLGLENHGPPKRIQ